MSRQDTIACTAVHYHHHGCNRSQRRWPNTSLTPPLETLLPTAHASTPCLFGAEDAVRRRGCRRGGVLINRLKNIKQCKPTPMHKNNNICGVFPAFPCRRREPARIHTVYQNLIQPNHDRLIYNDSRYNSAAGACIHNSVKNALWVSTFHSCWKKTNMVKLDNDKDK